jgi:hypothetical protein
MRNFARIVLRDSRWNVVCDAGVEVLAVEAFEDVDKLHGWPPRPFRLRLWQAMSRGVYSFGRMSSSKKVALSLGAQVRLRLPASAQEGYGVQATARQPSLASLNW